MSNDLVYRFPKNEKEEFGFSVREFKDRLYCDIRIYFKGSYGGWHPTRRRLFFCRVHGRNEKGRFRNRKTTFHAGGRSMKYSVNPAISELERAYQFFNGELFGGGLDSNVVITIQSRGRKSALGWHWVSKWKNIHTTSIT